MVTDLERRRPRASALLAAVLVAACGTGGGETPAAPAAAGSPSPSGEAIVRSFLSRFASKSVPFHVKFDGTVTVRPTGGRAAETVGMSGGLDARGSDAAGTITLELPGAKPTEVGVVIVGGKAYARPPGGDWQRNPGFRQTQPINPFMKLRGAKDLQYVGVESRGGAELHHLRTTKWIGDDPANAAGAGLKGAKVKSSTFDIFTESDGTPVEAELKFVVAGKSGGTAVEAEGDIGYEFSNVGKPVKIKPPRVP